MWFTETERRRTRPVRVGSVIVGGDAAVSIQSMTNTDTADVRSTLAQIAELAELGCEIVRCAVPDKEAVRSLAAIKEGSPVPVVADVHFRPDLAVRAVEAGVDGVRVNPGNMRNVESLKEVFRAAGDRRIKVRIGVNSGSIMKRQGMAADAPPRPRRLAELMAQEALSSCETAEAEGCSSLVLSLKASEVPTTVAAYRYAAGRCDYPFHLGVTAAGPLQSALVKSSIGIGTLLAEGIGDTIRVSITGPPHQEVKAAQRILECLGLREPSGPRVVSCPTCGRCEFDLAALVEEVTNRLEGYKAPLKVAIMGCVVNGPGEAADADVGVAGGKESGYIFRNGKKTRKVDAAHLVGALLEEIDGFC